MQPYLIDLTLFHQEDHPERPQKPLDKFNAATGSWSCRLLEWSGWYKGSIELRLLGHYRLFQIFKKRSGNMPRLIPLTQAYILQYHSGHGIKYFLSRTVAFHFLDLHFGRTLPLHRDRSLQPHLDQRTLLCFR